MIDTIKQKFDPTFYSSEESTEAIRTLYSIELAVNNASYEYLSSIKSLHKVILANLEKFKKLLFESIPDYVITTTTGRVEKPMGLIRLEVIHLFYALLLPNNPEMDEAFAKSGIMEHLFVSYFFILF